MVVFFIGAIYVAIGLVWFAKVSVDLVNVMSENLDDNDDLVEQLDDVYYYSDSWAVRFMSHSYITFGMSFIILPITMPALVEHVHRAKLKFYENELFPSIDFEEEES